MKATNPTHTAVIAVAVLALTFWGNTAPVSAQPKSQPASGKMPGKAASMFDNLGGLAGIAVITDDFISHLIGNQMPGMGAPMPMGTNMQPRQGGADMSAATTKVDNTAAGDKWAASSGHPVDNNMPSSGQAGAPSQPMANHTMGTGMTGMGMSGMGYQSGANLTLLKFNTMSELCEAAGGPCRFDGSLNIADLGHLQITSQNWDGAILSLRSDLTERGITGTDQNKLVDALNNLHSHIVTNPATR